MILTINHEKMSSMGVKGQSNKVARNKDYLLYALKKE